METDTQTDGTGGDSTLGALRRPRVIKQIHIFVIYETYISFISRGICVHTHVDYHFYSVCNNSQWITSKHMIFELVGILIRGIS